MPINRVDTETFLQLAETIPVFDVRSPGEYQHAHIPGAISFPLFTDDQRKIVGTAYKIRGREEAIRIGLDFFGPVMRPMVEKAETLLKELDNDSSKKSRPVLVHCWRGGMRSGAVAWLLDLYGFKVYTLAGGYKSYRRYVLDSFMRPVRFNIIGGYTGSGKTGLLQQLKEKGETVIDLEAIAKHKGSAFGNIGMPAQPGQEMFENLLSAELVAAVKITARKNHNESSTEHFVWLEDESQRIGLVNLPNEFWNNMRRSPLYFIEIPFEARLQQVVKEYGALDKQRMIDAIGRIKDKLGSLNAKNAILLLEDGKITECFEILLKYYDKFYLKALHNREGINSLLQRIESKSITSENADLLLEISQLSKQKV